MRARNLPTWLACGLGLLGALAGCGSATDDRPAHWSYISPAIIQPNCATASCHSDIAQRAGVNLSTKEKGYASLVGRFFTAFTPVPGDDPLVDAQNAEVIALMHAIGARRMPPDFPLPEVDIQLVARWISEGAQDN
jgi:hypothetical protein